MTIFDSSGIEAFVTENNPKYANQIIKQLKTYVKAHGFDKSYNPYKAAYGSISSHASANPNIVVKKKSDSPDEDKCVHDSKLLIPTLKDFFWKHPLINPKTFLGDAAFDTVELYKSLLTSNTFGDNKHFSKAYIPLNARSELENQDYTISENSIPCCSTT